MGLGRLIVAIGVCACMAAATQAMSRQPSPLFVSYRTGAYAAAPVIYTLTINGRALFSPQVADFGAAEVPPVGSGTISTSVQRLPPPDDTILDIRLEWTEIWTGRQFAAQAQLDEDLYPWFDGDGVRLDITFGQNGGLQLRVISEERWKQAMAMTGSGLPTLADYPVAFETCAPPSTTPALNPAEVSKLLGTVFAVDAAALQARRDTPLPEARCAGKQE